MSDYDRSLKQILDNGRISGDRTGVGTKKLFCLQSRFDISTYFPLITKRRIYPKAMVAELLWFLSGSTNNNTLKALGANFWSDWVDKDFEKKNGFEDGSFGPLYGFQLRHFGGNYNRGIEGNYGYGFDGVDQLEYVIDLIKNNPESRRILWSLWNPKQLEQMKLPPCHVMFQFDVDVDNQELSGVLYQRSCDVFIGGCVNIGFYSALLHMVAQQTGLKAKEFIHFMADAHIYLDQIPFVEKYLSRTPIDSPKLKLNKAKDILSYTQSDFVFEDYTPHSPIKAPIAI